MPSVYNITPWRVRVGVHIQTLLYMHDGDAVWAACRAESPGTGLAGYDAATYAARAAAHRRKYVAVVIWAIPSCIGGFRGRGTTGMSQGITCSRRRIPHERHRGIPVLFIPLARPSSAAGPHISEVDPTSACGFDLAP